MDYCVRRFARLRISGARGTLPVLNSIQDLDDLFVDMVLDTATT